ncbi:MFS transporter [Patescibacteria group bacterium]|nr:MFS transporter [Patescibacteria group bacterium]MBU1721842.1 MFS transporter [Patescibacteria group bacterium]MBU1901663.1 MFS transporter [Patescibacteria group bacterium]
MAFDRINKLKKNKIKLFWIRALMNVKMLNIVMSIFYVHRGIQLHEIFYLSIIWGATNLLTEIPSSYMADQWGRKKTILLGIIGILMYWIFYFFADSFFLFAVGTIWYALSFSMISGTDQALLYDSERELKQTKQSLKTFGTFSAASNIFKVFATLIGVIIAKDLIESQFQILISIDVIVTVAALGLGYTLVEANHKIDVEKIESGVMIDAINLLKKNKLLLRAILGRVILFTGSLVLFHYYQVFFVGMGLPLLALGIGFSLMHASAGLFKHYGLKYIPKKRVRFWIDIANWIEVLSLLFFLLAWVTLPNPYLLYTIYLIFVFFSVVRNPLYNELYHGYMKSYNRATAVSLTNLLKNVFDIPLLFISGMLIQYNIIAPYVFVACLAFIVVLFLRVGGSKYSQI